MILGHYGKLTEAAARGRRPKGFPADLFKATRRKLTLLGGAKTPDDLRRPPAEPAACLGP